jgi:hypothetical protein
MRHFEGIKDEQRRTDAAMGLIDVDGNPFRPYKKQPITFAVQMHEPFRVETLEGDMEGKDGDYLAIGIHGEMYPIQREVFEATYTSVDGALYAE